jgi:phage terminase small subunit
MGNQNSGPRPKPTALKVLRGVARKDRLNPAEPLPPAGDVVQPVELSRPAVKVWQELAPICLAMRTLTTADVRPFATLCELQATFMAAARRKGTKAFDPRLERETAIALRPYYALFGLEPVSRARLVVPKVAAEPASKWAGLK